MVDERIVRDKLVWRPASNLHILWRGDLQIALRDRGFPVRSEDPMGTKLCEYIPGDMILINCRVTGWKKITYNFFGGN